jgi:sortase A
MRLVVRLILVAALVAVATPVTMAMLRPVVQDQTTAAAQVRLRGELPEQADLEPNRSRASRTPVAQAVAVGDALGTLRIPRFGPKWEWVVLEGASDEVIADGPGRYSDTGLPGARGNVGIAAHRAGHGDPFIDFDRLQVGDLVEFSQAGTTWTYRITRSPEIVPINATWVLRPHPEPGSTQWRRELTLTTCWPKYGSSKRMYVRAVLDQVRTETT